MFRTTGSASLHHHLIQVGFKTNVFNKNYSIIYASYQH